MQSQIVEKRDFLTVGEMWKACLKNWVWFVLSTTFMLSLAYIFMRKTKPIYFRSASLMVMSNRNNEEFKFSDLKVKGLGIETSKTNLKDEISILHSPYLVSKVVDKLHLDVQYRIPGYFYNQLVYGQDVPVNVIFCDRSISDASFKLSLKDNGKLELSEFSNDLEKSIRIQSQIGDTVKTTFGKIVITGKNNYEEIHSRVPVLIVNKILVKDVTTDLLKNLTVENQTKWTDVIRITLVDQSIERGDAILNTLMQVYDENSMRIHSQKAANTVQFLTKRVQELSSRLNNIDSNIAWYKGANLISDMESNQGMYFKDSYEQASMINNYTNQVTALNYVKQNMAQNLGTNGYIPTDIGIESHTITRQINNYNALQLERNDLAATTGVGNPKVVDLDRQLTIYRNAIFNTIEQTTALMQTKLDGMEGIAGNINKNMANTAHYDMHLTSTGRLRRVLEELYGLLYLQKEKSEIALSHNVSSIRILQKPYGSPIPIAPLKKQIMLMGLVAGLALPFVGVFFKTINDDKIYSRLEIEDLLLPIVGEIPHTERKISWYKKPKVKRPIRIFIDKNSRNAFNESIRLLRTNLEFMQKEKDAKLCVMMTSAEPNCGKSFVSANLSASISLIGKKVILIDLDMRKATASTFLKEAKRGVANYLSYRCDNLSELICKDAFFKGVDLLPVGTIPPNPTELLQGKRTSEMMSWLKEHYDFIIIDCPPVDIVADDDIINVYADITLYVLRAGQTNVQMLSDANYLYSEKRFKNLCAVLNGVKELRGGKKHYYGSSEGKKMA